MIRNRSAKKYIKKSIGSRKRNYIECNETKSLHYLIITIEEKSFNINTVEEMSPIQLGGLYKSYVVIDELIKDYRCFFQASINRLGLKGFIKYYNEYDK